MALTEEDKAHLSPAEIEVLEALEDDPEGELDSGEEDLDEDEGAGEGDEDEDDPDVAGADDEPPAKADDAKPTPAAADAALPETYVPQFTKDDAAALDALKKDMAILDEQVEEGDISFVDWRAKRATLEEKKTDLDLKKRADEIEVPKAEARANAAWNNAVSQWFSAQKLDPTSMPQDAVKNFDAIVRSVTGGDLGDGLSMEAQLDLALSIFEQRGGKWPSTGKKSRRRTQETLIPPTVADLGTADGAGVGDGEFARLDRLLTSKPLEYEAAIMKLSPDRREAYLQTR